MDDEREFLEREIRNSTTTSLDRLFELWSMIGIKNLRENRVNAVLGHVANIYKTMIDEEELNLDKITKSIGKCDRERKELIKDLGDKFVDDGQEETMTLVDVEYKIRNEVLNLREKKSQRMKVYNDIREAEKNLCESTGSLPLNLMIDRMPTDGHVKQIEKYIIQLKDLRRRRETEFEDLTNKIRHLYERLEIEPRNSHERDLVCGNVESLQLSSETMTAVKDLLQNLEFEMNTNNETAKEVIEKMRGIAEKLKMPFDLASLQREFYSTKMINSLQEQFHELEEERRKHMDVFIKSAQVELEKIWKSCYISENEKTSFYAILETKVGDPESTLELYESHIDNWKKFHENHLALFIKIEKWFSLWDDRLQLESQTKDPSRLGNFKVLREEEKRRKRVNQGLPKVIDEIKNLTQEYYDQNGKDFLISGMAFDELNNYKEAKHNQEVSMEKEKKKEEKKKLIASETIYGSVPKTPTSNRTMRSKTANKTQNSVKRLQQNSKLLGKDLKSFATPRPRTPTVRTPGRSALRERNGIRNETFVSGSNMTKTSIATIDGHIFSNGTDVASSTLRGDQTPRFNFIPPSPSPMKATPMSSLKKSTAKNSRPLRSAKKIPFLM